MGRPLNDKRAVIETRCPATKTRPGIIESAADNCTCVPMASLVRRLAARGGPRLSGSRANTNKGVSGFKRDFNAGAMRILTVTCAPADPCGLGLVPTGDAFVPDSSVEPSDAMRA